VIFGGMAIVSNLPGYRPGDVLLRDLERRAAALPVAELPHRLRQMAERGDEGVATVARLLADEDEAVVEAAQVVLSDELDRWRRLPREESAPKAMHLARVLAELPPLDSSRARAAGEELAMRLMLWPAADASQAGQLTRHCERILHAIK
jgi:hypothetical protein